MWPENTERAFLGAASIGYRFFETDVRLTSDQKLVCFHDATLERTTNGFGPVAGLSLTELRQLDAGFRHRVDGHFPFRGQGMIVPTLEEMLTAIPDSGWVIDLKAEGTAEALADTVIRLGWQERVIVGSFSEDRLLRFRELTGGRVPTSTSYGETMKVIAAVAGAQLIPSLEDPFQFGVIGLQVPETWYGIPVVTPAILAFAHARGRLVHVWTVNHSDDMARLVALGVDGIITDRPDLFLPDLFGPIS